MNNKTHPTYDEIHYTVCNFVKQIEHENYDLIGIIARGGMLPGKIISHKLNIPTFTVYYSSEQGKGESHHQYTLPTITNKKILLVDEITDSGNTINDLIEFYDTNNCVHTYTIYWKNTAIIKPTFHSVELNEIDGWVYMPWEI